MKFRMKKRGVFGVKRFDLDGKIGKIERREDPAAGNGMGMDVFFKGLEGIGVVTFSESEVGVLREKLKERKKAVKSKK